MEHNNLSKNYCRLIFVLVMIVTVFNCWGIEPELFFCFGNYHKCSNLGYSSAEGFAAFLGPIAAISFVLIIFAFFNVRYFICKLIITVGLINILFYYAVFGLK